MKIPSNYELSCGAFIRQRMKTTNSKELYKEHNCYHVRTFNYKGERTSWETRDTYTEAVKLYRSIKG